MAVANKWSAVLRSNGDQRRSYLPARARRTDDAVIDGVVAVVVASAFGGRWIGALAGVIAGVVVVRCTTACFASAIGAQWMLGGAVVPVVVVQVLVELGRVY